MRKMLLITFSILLFISNTIAQTKPKEKVPSGNEMEELMKEAQKELDNLSPEDKKMMEDMGIKVPSLKDVPKVGDKQLSKAYDKETQIVPMLDVTRIAGLKTTPLNAGNMGAYISTTNGKLLGAIKAIKNSIKHSYTNEKEDRLRKLGYKLTGKDMNWDLPRLKADLLVLSENKQPEYPKTVDACIASERIWQEFQQKCAAKSAVLEQKLGPLKDFMEQQRKSRIQADLSLVGGSSSVGGTGMFENVN